MAIGQKNFNEVEVGDVIRLGETAFMDCIVWGTESDVFTHAHLKVKRVHMRVDKDTHTPYMATEDFELYPHKDEKFNVIDNRLT